MLSHGMKKSDFTNITMRKIVRRRYHGKKIEVNIGVCHDTVRKEFCHGNGKEVVVK